MKKILFFICLSLFLFGCKSKEEKLRHLAFENINNYLQNLSKKTDYTISDLVVKKIDSSSTYKETEILFSALLLEQDKLYKQRSNLARDLNSAENSLELSQEINKNSNFQAVVNNDMEKRNILRLEYESINKEYIEIESQANKLLNQSKKMDKNDLQSLIAFVDYKAKSPNSTIEPVQRYFFISKDGELYEEEVFLKLLKNKYIN